MVQTAPKLLSFDDYIEQYPEDGGNYELIDGRMIEVRPRGKHEKIGRFMSGKLFIEIERLKLPYFIPKSAAVKPNRPGTGYIPDVIVLDQQTIVNDPYWEKSSSISLGSSARLVIEIVSSNWRDDYLQKFDDYEALGIFEYWIIDYLALASSRYIGMPKVPTISIYHLEDGEYQASLFKGEDTLISPTFPELMLTAEQIFNSGNN